MVLCHAHHVETNDEREYTIEVLKVMKQDHEKNFEESEFKMEEGFLRKIADDIQGYWDRIDSLNRLNHVAPPDVAVQIEPPVFRGRRWAAHPCALLPSVL